MILGLASPYKAMNPKGEGGSLQITERPIFDCWGENHIDSSSFSTNVFDDPKRVLTKMIEHAEITEWKLYDHEGDLLGYFTVFDILTLLREQGKI